MSRRDTAYWQRPGSVFMQNIYRLLSPLDVQNKLIQEVRNIMMVHLPDLLRFSSEMFFCLPGFTNCTETLLFPPKGIDDAVVGYFICTEG